MASLSEEREALGLETPRHAAPLLRCEQVSVGRGLEAARKAKAAEEPPHYGMRRGPLARLALGVKPRGGGGGGHEYLARVPRRRTCLA